MPLIEKSPYLVVLSLLGGPASRRRGRALSMLVGAGVRRSGSASGTSTSAESCPKVLRVPRRKGFWAG